MLSQQEFKQLITALFHASYPTILKGKGVRTHRLDFQTVSELLEPFVDGYVDLSYNPNEGTLSIDFLTKANHFVDVNEVKESHPTTAFPDFRPPIENNVKHTCSSEPGTCCKTKGKVE